MSRYPYAIPYSQRGDFQFKQGNQRFGLLTLPGSDGLAAEGSDEKLGDASADKPLIGEGVVVGGVGYTHATSYWLEKRYLLTGRRPHAACVRYELKDPLLRSGFGAGGAKLHELRTAIMERALFSAEEARDVGLIDELAYWDDLRDSLIPDDEGEFEAISSAQYAKIPMDELELGGEVKIAVIHAQGMIGGRKSRVDPMLGLLVGYESVIADLEKAADDDSIDAIVLRVDSPGGVAYDSDQMGHVVESVSARKPVVVSMVDVAASGGDPR